MYKRLLLMVLSILTYEIASCDEEPHLCRQLVTVNYTETVTRPMEDYGSLATYFKELNISAGKKNVTLTKLEEKEVCCPGFEESSDEKCEPIQSTTTTSTTTTESESSSTQTPSTDQGNTIKSVKKSINIRITLILAVVLGVGALIVIISFVIHLYIRKKRRSALDSNSIIVKFNSDTQAALLFN